ncbi:hypothetical protein ACN47E_000174 [Coniothyrium glycines]
MSFLQASSASRMNAPSPTPSNSSANGAKRKRPTDSGRPVVYSQPQDIGTGEHVRTRYTYATEYLREHPEKWIKFDDIMDFLNVTHGDPQREQLRRIFRSDYETNRISWNSANETYRYKPKLQIRNASQLKGFFQAQKSAMGLPIRDLKDGWANVADDIKALEDKKEVLVKRTKDGVPKTVWNNDPSFHFPMDPDFLNQWHKVAIPATSEELRSTLLNVGLSAASAPRQIVTGPKEKKKRQMRRGGKQTNTHMAHILKDFSGMRK